MVEGIDRKEFAGQMRMNAVIVDGVVRVSKELWWQIADMVENSAEVVRCKKCRHAYNGIANLMCGRSGQKKGDLRLGGVSVKDDHFCSYGERKEGK